MKKAIKKGEYRCACCNNPKKNSNTAWKDYMKGSPMAVCKPCKRKIDAGGFKTIRAYTKDFNKKIVKEIRRLEKLKKLAIVKLDKLINLEFRKVL